MDVACGARDRLSDRRVARACVCVVRLCVACVCDRRCTLLDARRHAGRVGRGRPQRRAGGSAGGVAHANPRSAASPGDPPKTVLAWLLACGAVCLASVASGALTCAARAEFGVWGVVRALFVTPTSSTSTFLSKAHVIFISISLRGSTHAMHRQHASLHPMKMQLPFAAVS